MSKIITTSIADLRDHHTLAAIWRILQAIDSEFVPPLSARQSTTALELNAGKSKSPNGPNAYFNELIRQVVVTASIESHLAGFLAFKYQYPIELLPEYTPCNYITTIGVSPEYRNLGVGLSMYQYILTEIPTRLKTRFWVTRTWSQNHVHLRLLDGIGFKLVKTIPHHRGPNLHTLYYACNTELKIGPT